jgi:hypothetical protein
MPDVSINNLYCTDTSFHETVYWGSETCSSDDSRATADNIYNAGECFHKKMQFVSCTNDPCASDDVEDDEMAVAFGHMTSEA